MKILFFVLLLFCSYAAKSADSAANERLLEINAAKQANELIREQAREAKILQSIESFNKTVDFSDVEHIKQIDESTKKSLYIEDINQNISPIQDEFEEIIFDEDFEFIEDEFEAEAKKIEQEPVKLPTNKLRNVKDELPIGVGIKGKEEVLINELDKSDLMDFEQDLDIWQDDIQLTEDKDDDI